MVIIDAARAGEAQALTDLALASKRHWGYDEEFMARCRSELTLSERDLETKRVGVARGGGDPLGFYLLTSIEEPTCELDMLFVEPSAIGTGVGEALICDALEVARAHGCTHVRVVSDPFAASFYEHVGATLMGSTRTESTGRTLPVYEFTL